MNDSSNTKMLIELSPEDLRSIMIETFESVLKKNLSQTDIGDQVLSPRETAKFVGVSAPTLNRWKNEGQIPFHQIGGRVFYRKSEVLDFISSKTN